MEKVVMMVVRHEGYIRTLITHLYLVLLVLRD
jgi:hypothetical protein